MHGCIVIAFSPEILCDTVGRVLERFFITIFMVLNQDDGIFFLYLSTGSSEIVLSSRWIN